jgi:L-lactate dehydrogenase complex protein LldG
MTPPDQARRFLENAGIAAAGTHLVFSEEELRRVLSEIVPGDATVYCPESTGREKMAASVLSNRVGEIREASVAVEEVFGGIAETGSLVCSSAGGRAVQAGLLPAHHVAIVSRTKIFASLDEFFASCGEEPPTNVTLVTGPSRTADIELTLAIGVHGPERLDIIVY